MEKKIKQFLKEGSMVGGGQGGGETAAVAERRKNPIKIEMKQNLTKWEHLGFLRIENLNFNFKYAVNQMSFHRVNIK